MVSLSPKADDEEMPYSIAQCYILYIKVFEFLYLCPFNKAWEYLHWTEILGYFRYEYAHLYMDVLMKKSDIDGSLRPGKGEG